MYTPPHTPPPPGILRLTKAAGCFVRPDKAREPSPSLSHGLPSQMPSTSPARKAAPLGNPGLLSPKFPRNRLRSPGTWCVCEIDRARRGGRGERRSRGRGGVFRRCWGTGPPRRGGGGGGGRRETRSRARRGGGAESKGTGGLWAQEGSWGRAQAAGERASLIQEVVSLTSGAGRSWSETSKMRGVGPREGRERRRCLPPGERQVRAAPGPR